MSISNSSFSATWDGIHPLPFKVWIPDPGDPVGNLIHKFKFLDRLTTLVPAGISLLNPNRLLSFRPIGFRKVLRRDKRLWKRHFTTPDGVVLSPQDILDLIETDLNQQAPHLRIRCIVRVRLYVRTVDLQLIPYMKTADGRVMPLALSRLILHPRKKQVCQRTIAKLEAEEPGLGTDIPFVPSLMRNSIRLFERLGYDSIHLSMGYSAGSAVWPKYAFYPTDKNTWRHLKRVVSDKLAHLPGHVRAAALKRLKAIHRNDEAQNIYWLSDLTYRKLGIDPTSIEGDYTKHKLGSILLQRLNWKGKLDLRDRRARRRLERYLAEKNCPLP